MWSCEDMSIQSKMRQTQIYLVEDIIMAYGRVGSYKYYLSVDVRYIGIPLNMSRERLAAMVRSYIKNGRPI